MHAKVDEVGQSAREAMAIKAVRSCIKAPKNSKRFRRGREKNTCIIYHLITVHCPSLRLQTFTFSSRMLARSFSGGCVRFKKSLCSYRSWTGPSHATSPIVYRRRRYPLPRHHRRASAVSKLPVTVCHRLLQWSLTQEELLKLLAIMVRVVYEASGDRIRAQTYRMLGA